MFDKKASTHFPINELLASRWRGRAYDPDKFLSREDINYAYRSSQIVSFLLRR